MEKENEKKDESIGDIIQKHSFREKDLETFKKWKSLIIQCILQKNHFVEIDIDEMVYDEHLSNFVIPFQGPTLRFLQSDSIKFVMKKILKEEKFNGKILLKLVIKEQDFRLLQNKSKEEKKNFYARSFIKRRMCHFSFIFIPETVINKYEYDTNRFYIIENKWIKEKIFQKGDYSQMVNFLQDVNYHHDDVEMCGFGRQRGVEMLPSIGFDHFYNIFSDHGQFAKTEEDENEPPPFDNIDPLD
jgi:hypothetical protein